MVTGGQLDDNHFKGIKEEKFGPLTIYGLYGEGYVIIPNMFFVNKLTYSTAQWPEQFNPLQCIHIVVFCHSDCSNPNTIKCDVFVGFPVERE